jgi:hypothetical protein
MARPIDGEAFWQGLRTYRLEEIVKDNVVERRLDEYRRKPNHGVKRGNSRKPQEPMGEAEKEELRGRVDGGWEAEELPIRPVEQLESGEEDKSLQRKRARENSEVEQAEDAEAEVEDQSGDEGSEAEAGESRKPKSKGEAEAAVMPFRNGSTNRQLIAMVEAGKRSGMAVAEVEAWVWAWIERSRSAGYTGDFGRNGQEVGRRVASLYARANVAVSGRKKWLELWDEENGKYPRDEALAERMVGELGKVLPMAPQRERVVKRFFSDLDVWRRVIDDEAGRKPCRLDSQLMENQKRRAYPLPQTLLRQLYGKYAEIWKACEASGVVVKETVEGGGYAPSIGRPQCYQIMK